MSKAFAICFVLFVFLKLCTANTFNKCINNWCKCSDDFKIIKCSCDETNTNFDLPPQGLYQNVDYLSVQNCKEATFFTLAFSKYQPKELEIINVDNFNLQPSVFHEIIKADSIKKVTIKNSKIKNLLQNSFHNVSGIGSIEFNKVTIGTIHSNAFNTVTNFSLSIIDSHIDIIQNFTFVNVCQVASIEMRNTIIKQVEEGAISMNNGQNFTISNVTLGDWKKNWVTLDHFKKVSINKCQIEKIEESALRLTNVELLVFENNIIKNAASDAFKAIALPSATLQFNGNVIKSTEEKFNSNLMLEAVKSQLSGYKIFDNAFPCDVLCKVLEVTDKLQVFSNNNCANENLIFKQEDFDRSQSCKQPEADLGRSINEDGQTQTKTDAPVTDTSSTTLVIGTKSTTLVTSTKSTTLVTGTSSATPDNSELATSTLITDKPNDSKTSTTSGQERVSDNKHKTPKNLSNSIQFSYAYLLLVLFSIFIL